MGVYFMYAVLPCILCIGAAYFYFLKYKPAGMESHSSIGYFTVKELAFSLAASIAFAVFSLLFFALYNSYSAADVQLISGQVTDKRQVRVSCEHSYSCNCYTSCTGSGSSRICSRKCSTCYDHTNDWDWMVYSTVGSTTISRVDRRGSKTPPRWDEVQVGEYFARSSLYQNYLLLDKHSVFLIDESITQQYKNLPAYPAVYDYYRVKPVINYATLDTSFVEPMIQDYLKVNAGTKQVNIVAVFTHERPQYGDAILANWKGGKKNDVVMIYGINKETKAVDWFTGNTYAAGMNNRQMLVDLKLTVLGDQFTADKFRAQLDIVHKKYERIPAAQFKNLITQVEPPLGLIIFVMLLNAGATVGIILFSLKN